MPVKQSVALDLETTGRQTGEMGDQSGLLECTHSWPLVRVHLIL